MSTELLALCGAFFGAGLLIAASGSGLSPISTAVRRPQGARLGYLSLGPGRLLTAGASGLVAFDVTRWPMAGPLALLAVLGIWGLGGSPEGPVIERLEAVSAWTEMLRDTLAGAAGLTQAIITTASIAPLAIRGSIGSLAARVGAGLGLVPALVELGRELGDPGSDLVVACLVMAASERAQRLGELLSALAATTREEVAMRLDIEASRASARTAVRMITGISFGLLAVLAVFARSYLAPYKTLSGQAVLALVGCIFGLGLLLMSVLVRPRTFPRLELERAVTT
ncbi:MAG: type II secretion system F family protein [Acidimicrobiales bacterium]